MANMRSKYFYKAKDLTALSRVTQLSVEDDGESGVLAPKLQSNKPHCVPQTQGSSSVGRAV